MIEQAGHKFAVLEWGLGGTTGDDLDDENDEMEGVEDFTNP